MLFDPRAGILKAQNVEEFLDTDSIGNEVLSGDPGRHVCVVVKGFAGIEGGRHSGGDLPTERTGLAVDEETAEPFVERQVAGGKETKRPRALRRSSRRSLGRRGPSFR